MGPLGTILGTWPTKVLSDSSPLSFPAAARHRWGRSVAPSAQALIHACRITICSRSTRHNEGPLSCHSSGAANTPGPCFWLLALLGQGVWGELHTSMLGKAGPLAGPAGHGMVGQQPWPDELAGLLHLWANLPNLQEFGGYGFRESDLCSLIPQLQNQHPPAPKNPNS